MNNDEQTFVYQVRDVYGVRSEHPTMDSAIAAKWKMLNPHAYFINAKPIVRENAEDEGVPLQRVDCE